MTEAELHSLWARFMHRSDLEADLEAIFALASERVKNRLLWIDPDIATILVDAPGCMLHAGLMLLHELAQDDEGIAREAQLFDVACSAYSMRHSLQNVTPVARHPLSEEA
jgi:hypothetical protein